MDCFFLASGTVAVDLPRDCGGRIRSRSSDQNTMKAPQPEFRVIPQFDSGRWKLRLERVPVDPVNETTMAMNFPSAAQAGVNKTNKAHSLLLPIERGRGER